MFLVAVSTKNTRTNTDFSDYTVMLKFWSDFGFTVLMAYFFYSIITALTGLDSILRPKGTSKAKAFFPHR
ncbi:nose resistant to fluoxetine protein 6-like [Drosophila madeirensis]|uniref:Nose resistant to fluoxetine protein 6-like n=1 Tax=Drosophila madeirensis TaxID=30013 RepID=A0AAU9EY97_DROMD